MTGTFDSKRTKLRPAPPVRQTASLFFADTVHIVVIGCPFGSSTSVRLMEKNHRLFLRNLPGDVNNDDLEKLFNEYGTITNVDIKEKIHDNGTRIAFVNITTTDANLNNCFRATRGTILRGNGISIEVAKESYLGRLKREREEAARPTPEVKTVVPRDQPIERINIKAPKTVKSKATKRIYHFDSAENEESPNAAPDFAYDPALEVETAAPEKPLRVVNLTPGKFEETATEAPKKKVLSESEIKRLASVKQKRQTFKTHGNIISQALKAVDNTRRNNKVVFSEDIDEISAYAGKSSKSLFDDDENLEDHADWNEDTFRHDEKRNAQLKLSLSNSNHDKRFEIDGRFLDETAEEKKAKDDEVRNETKWQLNILENVLGKPFKARDEKPAGKKQNKMIRYDPTSSGHQDHELPIEKPAIKKKKVKLPKVTEEEEKPIPVSSEVFYEVSENLTETLKPQEGFSLLKSFGTATAADKNTANEYRTTNPARVEKWESGRESKNPFKYESSDDEAPYPSMDQLTCKSEIAAKSQVKDASDAFFFAIDDHRFKEAEEFFSTRPTTADNFAHVRRELKQIVRSKIRNNVKKNTPWRNTKVARQAKIR